MFKNETKIRKDCKKWTDPRASWGRWFFVCHCVNFLKAILFFLFDYLFFFEKKYFFEKIFFEKIFFSFFRRRHAHGIHVREFGHAHARSACELADMFTVWMSASSRTCWRYGCMDVRELADRLTVCSRAKLHGTSNASRILMDSDGFQKLETQRSLRADNGFHGFQIPF